MWPTRSSSERWGPGSFSTRPGRKRSVSLRPWSYPTTSSSRGSGFARREPMRSSRRRDLTRLLREGRASSQRDMVEELRAAGHEVTQATISRDLQELGALKVRAEGGFVYRLPDEMPRGAGDFMTRNLLRTLEEFALVVRAACNVGFEITAPGHAAAVASAIDQAPNDDVV